MSIVADLIRKKRKSLSMTQQELATRTGLSLATIKQYELSKRQPRTEQLQMIADALGVTIDYLLGYEGEQAKRLIDAARKRDITAMNEILGINDGIIEISGTMSTEITGSVATTTDVQIAMKQIEKDYKLLNTTGRKVAGERVHELTLIDDYTKSEN